jgi:hypothetical protein
MYLSIAQEVSRRHREEIMQTVAAARLGTTHAKGEAAYRLVTNLRWSSRGTRGSSANAFASSGH